ncbi:MBL fold metallo-hydrolase [Alkanindiges sp. WGS2144]|uniref:MBL fold metallo-hydrolase n=1 Tax=Alkanindiges sp. WGS2144 TaxID=3366808 RepID=UPI00374FFB35
MLQYQIIPVTPFAQNCTLLWDDDSGAAVLIDAGGEAGRLKQAIDQKGLKLVALWLTHGHLDHAGAVGELAQFYQVPVIGPHKEDAFWLNALEQQSQMFGFPKPQPVVVHQWLEGGETLYLGSYPIEVRFAPGHTPGHVVLYSKDLNLVWTGDVLFAGSIGRTDFPRGNHQQLIESIQRELFSLPDDTRFIAGHGPMSTIGEERRTNPFVAGRAG